MTLENDEEEYFIAYVSFKDGNRIRHEESEYLFSLKELKEFIVKNKNIYNLRLITKKEQMIHCFIDIFTKGFFYKTSFDILETMFTFYKPTEDLFIYVSNMCYYLNKKRMLKEKHENMHELFLALKRKVKDAN